MFWLGQKKIWKKVPKVRKIGIFDKSEKIGNPVWQIWIFLEKCDYAASCLQEPINPYRPTVLYIGRQLWKLFRGSRFIRKIFLKPNISSPNSFLSFDISFSTQNFRPDGAIESFLKKISAKNFAKKILTR